jgi:hypothetical protein
MAILRAARPQPPSKVVVVYIEPPVAAQFFAKGIFGDTSDAARLPERSKLPGIAEALASASTYHARSRTAKFSEK